MRNSAYKLPDRAGNFGPPGDPSINQDDVHWKLSTEKYRLRTVCTTNLQVVVPVRSIFKNFGLRTGPGRFGPDWSGPGNGQKSKIYKPNSPRLLTIKKVFKIHFVNL